MNSSGIKALTFDVFGTVVDWRTSVADKLQAFFDPRGVSRDWHAVADDWRALYQPAMDDVRTGKRPFVILDVLHRENLVQLLTRHGIKDVSPADIDTLNLAWHRLRPWPDSVAGLQSLRPNFTLATLSNGNVSLMVNLARYGGLPWDAILGAEFARAYKPDPQTYLRTAEALGLEPEQCMMVAAHNSDLHAARDLGFATAYINRPTEYGPDQSIDLGPEADWDISCNNIVELADALA